MKFITVRGARAHNLKNIDLEIPRNQLVVITGLSGSGKSSLAFDTLYAEGQRRYVESLSAYARQFLSVMEKPDVDHIEGLSPAISIQQKSTNHNPRSTVGTITEIYDYLRLLFARVGLPKCPVHHHDLEARTVTEMVDQVISWPEGTKIMVLAPLVKNRKGEHRHILDDLRKQGFVRARINNVVSDLDDLPILDKNQKHTIEVVIDRLKIKSDLQVRLADSLEMACKMSDGIATIHFMETENEDMLFSARFACPECGYSISELEPRLFSFNNPAGACNVCDGLGQRQFFDQERIVSYPELTLAEGAVRGWNRHNQYFFDLLQCLSKHYDFSLDTPFRELSEVHQQVILYGSGDEKIDFSAASGATVRVHRFEGVIPNFERRYRDTEIQPIRDELSQFITTSVCSSCQGSRLCEAARNVFINNITLPEIVSMPVDQALIYFSKLVLKGKRGVVAEKILKELSSRLSFLVNVGLNYLTLSRSADTLSGGEAQRIRLASQIGAGLVGVLYILDEPSIGLHQRDNEQLLNTLKHLRNIGNTVIVVEHDEDTIRSADYVIDIGPGAGIHGGLVVAQGTPDALIANKKSLTGDYLAGRRKIEVPPKRRKCNLGYAIHITNCSGNNLNDVTLSIPAGVITCITGVSGSGKSTLINQTLYPICATALNGATTLIPAPHGEVKGLEHFDKCIDIDQSPIGRTPRSNPATYTGIFTTIRELFAGTQEARSRGYKVGRFSFNVKGGRCEACQGDGVIRVEMHFLPDMYVACDVCKGSRYNRETLGVIYKGKTIAQVLDMTTEEAYDFFEAVPALQRKLKTLQDVGLSYVQLGQNATTLSGGEAQRIKLARELSKRSTGKTLYILDEPTTGLHFHDIQQLLHVLQKLCDQGNTIVVIEHNLDVVKTADWLIDLGPEGGSGGGQIIAEGIPEDVIKIKASHTGRFLKPLLK